MFFRNHPKRQSGLSTVLGAGFMVLLLLGEVGLLSVLLPLVPVLVFGALIYRFAGMPKAPDVMAQLKTLLASRTEATKPRARQPEAKPVSIETSVPLVERGVDAKPAAQVTETVTVPPAPVAPKLTALQLARRGVRRDSRMPAVDQRARFAALIEDQKARMAQNRQA